MPYFHRDSGSIVDISLVGRRYGFKPWACNYLSKAVVEGFTRSWAVKLTPIDAR
jgi:NAD(P)-dependent dehydrogenase (short-subunit alcohol dehydrogenase family)